MSKANEKNSKTRKKQIITEIHKTIKIKMLWKIWKDLKCGLQDFERNENDTSKMDEVFNYVK